MSDLILPRPVGGSELVQRYLENAAGVARFFSGSPYHLASYRAKLEETRDRFGPEERAAAAATLRPTTDAARERLERFVAEGGAMVTTGQQAGLFTGPLYTIYKAVSAAALAQHLERELGTLVIPVFWVASEDHDWEEANHAYILGSRNRLHRLELPTADDKPVPMSRRHVGGQDERVQEILDEASQLVGGNKATADLVNRIVEPYRSPGATMAGAFSAAISEMLAPFDVCIADASNPQLKRRSVPVLERALTHSESAEKALAKRSSQLDQAGFRTQVAVLEGGTNLFFDDGTGRERLYVKGDSFRIRGTKWKEDRQDVLEMVRAEPGRFTPNVFLRPVVESFVYPTLAYVGGPGEIAYFAQVNALFEENGIQPPIVVPRFSGIVVEPRVKRLLSELDLDLAALRKGRDRLIEELAQRELPDSVRSSLDELRSTIADRFEKLIQDAGQEFGDSVAGPLGTARNRALLEASRAERKVVRAIKRSDRLAVDQLDRVLDSLRPLDTPQDRVLNVLPFLARYGDHFLRETEKAIQMHWRFPIEGD